MAKVSLRVYNREIEGMIEAGQLDEAIAHCQFILKTYPMHVETYLLLGKAFLESRRYSDAADIFARVLMAVPDNFVSHVGMSIIRDDEGKLDEAIWHMERAFEIQPSNPAIQGELRRLYGRRDGVEPPKIRLSRDALANMYAQGELFNQAIAEIRTVLAEDNNRPDLEVMLARAYFHAGQKVEAAGMASTLLKKYSYCMDALRILVDVLPGTTRSGDTQVYLQRLSMLDPYSVFATGSVFSTDKVADSAITLERLAYKPGAPHVDTQPDWAASLGIQLPGSKAAEPDFGATGSSSQPAGETSPQTAQKPETPAEGTPAVQAPATNEANVPDWMRSVGWHEATGEAGSQPPTGDAEPAIEPAAQADIPDWLKAIAPQAAATEPQDQSGLQTSNPAPAGEDNLDWLSSIAQSDQAGSGAPSTSPDSRVMPPAFADEGGPGPAAAPVIDTGLQGVASDTRPVPAEPAVAAGGEDLPDWLKNANPPGPVDEAAPVSGPGPETPPPAVQNEDLPDWLKPMAPAQPADQSQPVPGPTAQETPPESRNESLTGWLKSLSTQEAKEAEAASGIPAETPPPAVENEDMPDWLRSITPQPEQQPVAPGSTLEPPAVIPGEEPQAQAPIPEATLPDWLTNPQKTEETGAARAPEAELPATETRERPRTGPAAQPEATPVGEAPTLLQAAPPPLPRERGYETGPHPTTEPPFQPSGEAKPLHIEDDALAWLEGLAVKQGAREDEMLTRPEERPVEMPSSLSPAGGLPSVPPADQPATRQVDAPALEPVQPQVLEPIPEPAQSASQEPSLFEEVNPPSAPVDALPQGFTGSEAPEEPAPAGYPGQAGEDNLDWVTRELKEPEAPVQEQLPPADAGSSSIPGNDITITSWLTKMDVEEALMKARSSQPSEQSAETQAALPDWLKDLDRPNPSAQSAGAGKPVADLPEWLRQPVKPPEPEKNVAPPAENTPEAGVPAWLDEATGVSQPPAPSIPGDWLPAETNEPPGTLQPAGTGRDQGQAPATAPQPSLEPASPPLQPSGPSIVHLARSSGTGMLSNIPPQDKDGNLLMTAQMELDNNNLAEAMKTYLALIKKGRLLEEVIHDLREALYRFPVDIIVWQTLGDAYMRTNQLQDALDAYTKAEELLR